VGGYNIGNAVGLWCYYGSTGADGYRNLVPSTDDIDACLAAHARLPRMGMAWSDASPEGLADFDAEYYAKVDALRREYEHGRLTDRPRGIARFHGLSVATSPSC